MTYRFSDSTHAGSGCNWFSNVATELNQFQPDPDPVKNS
jgi:hypothetical protein